MSCYAPYSSSIERMGMGQAATDDSYETAAAVSLLELYRHCQLLFTSTSSYVMSSSNPESFGPGQGHKPFRLRLVTLYVA
jgi:hypothetical protein